MAGSYIGPLLAGIEHGERRTADKRQARQRMTLEDLLQGRQDARQQAGFGHAEQMQGNAQAFSANEAEKGRTFSAAEADKGRAFTREQDVEGFGRQVALKGIPAPAPAPQPYTLNPGDRRFSPDNTEVASVPPLPTKPTEGDKRAQEIDAYLQGVRGLKPGTPEYQTEFMNWRNRPLTIAPGGAVFNRTDVAPGPTAASPQPVVQRDPTPPVVPAEQTSQFADFRTLIGQFDKVRSLYKPEYVGSVQGRLGGLRTSTGIGSTPEEASFRSVLADVQNQIVYLKSGKQINEQEFKRLMLALPGPNDPDDVFVAKLNEAQMALREMLANRESEFQQRGYRNTGTSGTPVPSAGMDAPKSGSGLLPGVKSIQRVQ